MSVSVIQSNAILSSYEKASNYAKKYVSPFALDSMEMFGFAFSIGPMMTLASFWMASSSEDEMKTPLLKIAMSVIFGVGSALFGLWQYEKRIKKPVIQRQIDQIIEASQGLPKSMFVINSTGFSTFEGVGLGGCYFSHDSIDKVKRIANNYSIYYSSESKSPKQLSHYKQHDALFLEGHGNQYCIEILKDSTIFINELESFKHILSRVIKDQATIILHSCKTAKGDENIARQFSIAFPEATIIAPSNAFNKIEVGIDDDGMPVFTSSMFFRTCCARNTTRVYKTEISSLKMGNGSQDNKR